MSSTEITDAGTPRISAGVLCLWMFLAFALPALIFYMGKASSLALGTTIISSAILVGYHWSRSTVQAPLIGRYSIEIIVSILMISLWLHLVVASSLGPIDPIRAAASFGPLILMLFAASRAADLFFEICSESVHKAAVGVFSGLCGCALLAIAGLNIPGVNASLKPVFPFVEPSHFALSFTPFVMYASVTGRPWTRIAALVVGLVCAAWLQNLTLVVGCLLVICVSLRVWIAVIGVLVIVGAIVILQLDLSYFSDRLNFSADNNNLSTLVYVQGWQFIGEAWRNTGLWGVGFQQLGQELTRVPAAAIIADEAGDYLNLTDGGFVLAKLLCELGAFGLLIGLGLLYQIFRSFGRLRWGALNDRTQPSQIFLAYCFIVSFLLELIVRGMGYFTPTSFAMLTSLIFLQRIKHCQKATKNTGNRNGLS